MPKWLFLVNWVILLWNLLDNWDLCKPGPHHWCVDTCTNTGASFSIQIRSVLHNSCSRNRCRLYDVRLRVSGGGTVAVMYCSSDSGSNVMIWNICTRYRLFVWSEVTAGLNPCSGQIETRFGPRDCVTAPNWSDCRKWNRWHTAHMIHLMLLNVLSCTRIWGYLITSNSENFTPFFPPIL